MSGVGPLAGYRILELGGIGPVPFAGMMLADLGAEVIRIDKPHGISSLSVDFADNILMRGRKSVTLDLKDENALRNVLHLVEASDGVIEGYRPGVAERLGIGPGVSRRQPRDRVRPLDRVGARRSAGSDGGSRCELRRLHWRTSRDRLS